MKSEDKEAFEKWYSKKTSEVLWEDFNGDEIVIKAWQAACRYKQKEIDARKSELDYAARILTDVQADKLEMRGTIQKLQAENAKLRECVGFYADKDNWIKPYIPKTEHYLAKYKYHKTGSKRARQVLKELDNPHLTDTK